MTRHKRDLTTYGLEQIAWSSSNILMVMGIAALGTADRLPVLLGLSAALALQVGLIRAAYFEAREVGGSFPSLSIRTTGPLLWPSFLAFVYLAITGELGLGLLSLVAGFSLLVSEVRRSWSLNERRFGRLFVGHGAWASLTICGIALVAWHGTFADNADIVLVAWVIGAVVASFVYSTSSPPAGNAASGRSTGSIAEYLASGGIEQGALIAAAALLEAGPLAHLRFALAAVGPVNLLFAGWRAGALSGQIEVVKAVRVRLTVLAIGGAVWFLVLIVVQPSFAAIGPESLALLLPMALVARVAVGTLSVASLDGRTRRGFWRTALMRSLPSIALLVVPIAAPRSPDVVFLAVLLASLVGLVVIMTELTKGEAA